MPNSWLNCPPRAAISFNAIPRHQLAAIVKAFDILEPILQRLKISLEAGIEEYAGAKEVVGQKDLRKIAEEYSAEPWVKRCHTPIGVLAEEFIADRKKNNHRPAYTDGLFYTLRRLRDYVGETAIGDVTKAQLEAVIMAGGKVARSRQTYQTNIRTFFKWCKIQEYLNPTRSSEAEKLTKIKVDAPFAKIYTVEEAKQMLTDTRDVPGPLLLALGFFSGIRHAELQRIHWKDIQLGGSITVNPNVSKVRNCSRTIPILPVLRDWLEPFFGHTGMVLPYIEVRDKTSAHLRAAGSRWKRNGLRHSFASYRLADTDSVLETAKEDGHSAYILERHYKGRGTKEAAEEYFNLTPKACGQNDWEERVRQYIADNPPRTEPRKNNGKGPRPIVPPAQTEPAEAASQPSAITAPPSTGEEEGEQRAAA